MPKYLKEFFLAEETMRLLEHYFEISVPILFSWIVVYCFVLYTFGSYAVNTEKGLLLRKVSHHICVALLCVPLGYITAKTVDYINVPVWVEISAMFLLLAIYIHTGLLWGNKAK